MHYVTKQRCEQRPGCWLRQVSGDGLLIVNIFTKQAAIACAVGVLIGSGAAPIARAADSLHFAFDPARLISHGISKQPDEPFQCPKPVRAMKDMSKLFAFYVPDKTQSVIDRSAMSRYVKRVYPTIELPKRLLAMTEAFIASSNDQTSIASCITRQLRVWADADALLGQIEDNDPAGHRQAALVAVWASVAAANAFAFAQSGAEMQPIDRNVILDWLNRVSDMIVADFTPRGRDPNSKDAWLDATSNRSHWAAVSVGSIAALTQNIQKFDWAMEELRRGLLRIDPDGSLPSAMSRGGRAFHYQNFALQPLAMLVALADANGVTLSTAQENSLQSMATFTLSAFNDPTIIFKRVGRDQEMSGGMLSWIDILSGHFTHTAPDLQERLNDVAQPLRPFRDSFIGLNLTSAYLLAPPDPAKPTPPLNQASE